MLIVRLILAIASLAIIGYPAAHFLLEKNKDRVVKNWPDINHGIFNIFISFYIGIFISTIYLMVLSIMGFRFSLLNIAVFSLSFLIFSIYLFIARKKKAKYNNVTNNITHQVTSSGIRSSAFKSSSEGWLKNSIFAFIIFLIFANFIVVIFFTFLFPIRFWDAISCWSLKGIAFFIDGGVLPFYTQHDYSFAHPSYPLYLPMMQTWIYIWLGQVEETLVKVIFPIFYSSLIFIFYYLFRKRFNRIFSASLVFFISLLSITMDHGYLEYTNLLFSVILFISVFFFYRYWIAESKKTNYLLLSTIFFAMLSQVRTEGVMYLAIFLIMNTMMTALRFGRQKVGNTNTGLKSRRSLLIAIIVPILLTLLIQLPWLIIKSRLGLSILSSEWSSLFNDIRNGGIFASGLFEPLRALKAMTGEVIYSTYDSARAFLGSSYGLAWPALFLVLLFNLKDSFIKKGWIFAVFIFAGFGALFISLGLIEEFAWSIERYMFGLFPLTYFWIFYNLPLFKSKRDLLKNRRDL